MEPARADTVESIPSTVDRGARSRLRRPRPWTRVGHAGGVAAASLPTLHPDALQPYASFAVLVYTGPDVNLACSAIAAQLKRSALKETAVRSSTLIADGLAEGWLRGVFEVPGDEIVNIEAFAYRTTRTPSWAKRGSEYAVTVDELTVAFQRNDLVAVHCPRNQVDALQRWLDGNPKPAFRRVPGPILQEAFLQGEARGLWLRGTHRRQTTKADTKNLSGLSLGDALNPFEDSSFALTSGRSSVPDSQPTVALTGVVGTTPRKAWVWNSRTDSLSTFVSIAREALLLVADVMASPSNTLPFPELAVEVDSLSGVRAAYDAYISEPEELAQLPDVSDDALARAEVLRDVLIDVIGDPSGPTFTLSVGPRGTEVARIRCRPTFVRDKVVVDVGFAQPPSDPVSAASIRDAIDNGELVNVYYESGHVLARGALTRVNHEHRPFRGWSFADFTGFDVEREKPSGATPQDIHDAIAVPGEDSLFSWLVARFPTGHLTCDDGSNEVADFIHLDDGGLLTIIHVKGALASARRRVAAGAYELVLSQAVKNLRYINADRLLPALRNARIARPATWKSGARARDRQDMLDALSRRSPSAEAQIVIVQPHHTRSVHQALATLAGRSGASTDLLRFQLIETMLNSARGTAVGLGAEMAVWASDT